MGPRKVFARTLARAGWRLSTTTVGRSVCAARKINGETMASAQQGEPQLPLRPYNPLQVEEDTLFPNVLNPPRHALRPHRFVFRREQA